MLILGLDPSLTDTGWAVIDTSCETPLVASGRCKTTTKTPLAWRYRMHREELARIVKEYGPFDFVGIESPPPGGSMYAALYALYIQLQEVLWDAREDYATFLPTQVKAHIRGVLNDPYAGSKTDSKEAAKVVLGTARALNHNISDAVLVADMTAAFLEILTESKVREDLPENLQTSFFGKKTRRASTKPDGLLNKKGKRDGFFLLRSEIYESLY